MENILSVDEINDQEIEFLVWKNQLPEVCHYLLEERGGRVFTMVGSDERGWTGTLALYYVFAFDKTQQFVTVKALVSEEEPTFPSLAAELPAFNWYEREVKDLLGLRPQGHPDPRPLTLHGDWPEEIYPLRKDFPVGEWVDRVESRESFMRCQVGRMSPKCQLGQFMRELSNRGIRFGAVGDTVLHLDARLFSMHRGLEKISEGQSLAKALFIAERICGVCALAHTVSWRTSGRKCGEHDSAVAGEIPANIVFGAGTPV